jgi:hypothetical protein
VDASARSPRSVEAGSGVAPTSPRRAVPALDLAGKAVETPPRSKDEPISGRKSASASPRSEMTEEERLLVRQRLLERKKGREAAVAATEVVEEKTEERKSGGSGRKVPPRTTDGQEAKSNRKSVPDDAPIRSQSAATIERRASPRHMESEGGVTEERTSPRTLSMSMSMERRVSPRTSMADSGRVSAVRESEKKRSSSLADPKRVSPRGSTEDPSRRVINDKKRTSVVSTVGEGENLFGDDSSASVFGKGSESSSTPTSRMSTSAASVSLKHQSVLGLEAAESVFAAEPTDVFGETRRHQAHQNVLEGQSVAKNGDNTPKSPRVVISLEDVLPARPQDSGDKNRMFQYARQMRETLSNPKWAKEFQKDVEASFVELCALLEEWLSLDSPDQSELSTVYCEVVLAWVEFRLASDLPHLRHKCLSTFQLIEKAEEMLREVVAGSFVSWGSKALGVQEGLRAAKRKAMQADSKVLTRLATVLQDQIKETRRLKKSFKEKEAVLEARRK